MLPLIYGPNIWPMLKKVVNIAMLVVVLPLNLLLPSNNVNDTMPGIPNPKKIHEIMIRGGLKMKKSIKAPSADTIDDNSKDVSIDVRFPIFCQKIADGIAAIPAISQAIFPKKFKS